MREGEKEGRRESQCVIVQSVLLFRRHGEWRGGPAGRQGRDGARKTSADAETTTARGRPQGCSPAGASQECGAQPRHRITRSCHPLLSARAYLASRRDRPADRAVRASMREKEWARLFFLLLRLPLSKKESRAAGTLEGELRR